MRYRLADRHSKFLATRSRGAQVQEALLDALEEVPEGDHLVIDFEDVEDVTVSFIDESVGGLLAKRVNDEALSARGVILANLNADCEDTVDAVLKRRETAVIAVDTAGELDILGYRGWGWMPETLEASQRLVEFRASDLADALDVSPQAANNRLRHLVASGAIARRRIVPEGGGKEFQYRLRVLQKV